MLELKVPTLAAHGVVIVVIVLLSLVLGARTASISRGKDTKRRVLLAKPLCLVTFPFQIFLIHAANTKTATRANPSAGVLLAID
jgi:hypothetical protein